MLGDAPQRPGDEGKRNVRRIMNRFIGAVTYSAMLAAYYLLYGKDSECTFATKPVAHWAFVQELLPSGGGARAGDVAYTFVGNDERGGRTWTSDLTHYKCRDRALAALPPWVFFMWFKVVPIDNKLIAGAEDDDSSSSDGSAATAAAHDAPLPHRAR